MVLPENKDFSAFIPLFIFWLNFHVLVNASNTLFKLSETPENKLVIFFSKAAVFYMRINLHRKNYTDFNTSFRHFKSLENVLIVFFKLHGQINILDPSFSFEFFRKPFKNRRKFWIILFSKSSITSSWVYWSQSKTVSFFVGNEVFIRFWNHFWVSRFSRNFQLFVSDSTTNFIQVPTCLYEKKYGLQEKESFKILSLPLLWTFENYFYPSARRKRVYNKGGKCMNKIGMLNYNG